MSKKKDDQVQPPKVDHQATTAWLQTRMDGLEQDLRALREVVEHPLIQVPGLDEQTRATAMRFAVEYATALSAAGMPPAADEIVTYAAEFADFLAGVPDPDEDKLYQQLRDLAEAAKGDIPIHLGDLPKDIADVVKHGQEHPEEARPRPRQYGVDDSAYVPEPEPAFENADKIVIDARPLGETQEEFIRRITGSKPAPFPGTSPEDGKRP